MHTFRHATGAAMIALSAIVASAFGAAAQTGNVELELNTAQDINDGCRLTYVATNATQAGLEKVSYEVAVFDLDGLVQRLLVLEFGWLPSGKTRVVQFDLPEQTCASISRISVNGAVECSSAQGEQTVCRDRALLSTRVRTIQFN
ncbi:MAG: hypothetical protein ACK4GO_06425 [Gemmobacter sp.]